MALNVIQVNQRKDNNNIAPMVKSIPPSKIVKVSTLLLVGTCTRVTTVATAQIDNHGFVVGDVIAMTGDAPFSGNITVVTVIGTNSFTFTVSNSGATTGVIKVLVNIVQENRFKGMGAQLEQLQVADTLATLNSAFGTGMAALVRPIGDGSTEVAKLASPAVATQVIWPLSSIVHYRAINIRQITITDADRALTVVTATSAAHGLVTGQYIIVSGASDAALNGTYQVTVTNANTFTYTTATSGTITDATAVANLQVTEIFVNEDAAVAKKYYLNEGYATVNTMLTT